jgi:uncharacterized protein YlxP (DUF503 family)
VRITLRLPESGSLKDKRQVVRSVMQRVRNKFQVAMAEVAESDAWQIAVLGAACVSNDRRHAESILNEIVEFVRDNRLDAEVINIESDVIAMDD